MEIDVNLVDEFRKNRIPVLRLYRWEPFCISLGKNQLQREIDVDSARRDGIDIVFRPTGGKAVLHAEELTYSVVTDSHGLSVSESYNLLSTALANGIRNYVEKYNSSGAEISLAESMPDFRKLFRQPDSVVCFVTSAKSEIEYRGRKLVGSAQRRFGNIVLQHGSILVGEFHKKIVRYLKSDAYTLEKVKENLDNHTITLKEIINQEVDYQELKKSIVNGFVETLEIRFERVNPGNDLLNDGQRLFLNQERELA
ncbi:MAG: lipoate--protein ligase family protein [Candidatus Kryptoniota bacterium]